MAGVAACGGGSLASVGPATAAPSGLVTFEAKEYRFTPSSLTVPTGAVAVSVRNAGSQNHQFEVFKGDERVGGIDLIGAGQTKDATLSLKPGDYTFVCKLNGHDQLGMKGTLTVTGG